MGADDCASSSSPSSSSSSAAVNQTLVLLQSDDPNSRVQAAKDIRRLTKTSQRSRRHFSGAVGPLVDMLRCGSAEANEAALAALLNLAVKDEKNKIDIIEAGALKPIISFLQSENVILQEHAAAALITLSASPLNKLIIGASGAIPLLVNILNFGGPQAKTDSIMALYNLSIHPDNIILILQTNPIPPLITQLKTCKKSSKIAEKCTALIESLVDFDEGRNVILSEEGGILAVVEVVEGGSVQSREYAVGILLTMCEREREKYREAILGEGVIPGLLELTVHGTAKSRTKAQKLLRLLREKPYPRAEIEGETLENIVCNIMCCIDGEDQTAKARNMLSEMVQVSMEQSLRHLQQRALNNCSPEVALK